MKFNYHQKATPAILLGALLLSVAPETQAASISELKDMIFDRNAKIETLEKEIQQYEGQLKVVGQEKQTLQSAIVGLDVSRKKVSTDISLTQNKIGSTDLEINKLGLEITDKQTLIVRNKSAIAETLRTLNEIESDSLLESILTYRNLSEVWDEVEAAQRVQAAMSDDVRELTTLKEDLESKRNESETQKQRLARLKQELDGKKQVLDQNRKETDTLLSATKNKELTYQQMLAEKKIAYDQFQKELQEFEAQLQFAVDPESIPQTGQGVLGWPLANLMITQFFGNTSFAMSGAYSGSGHNGMDFRASVGTPVLASLAGTISGAGNTDSVPGCYSYGKWVLIKHSNGLSTLYAHLSVISVNAGDTVNTGDIIGYSGNTGYSTGPHLHYGVYLSDAVRIVRMSDVKAVTNCGPAYLPVAPLEGYLNPLDYLTSPEQMAR